MGMTLGVVFVIQKQLLLKFLTSMNVQKMKLKKQEHSAYRIVKKQEKTSHLHEKLLG